MTQSSGSQPRYSANEAAQPWGLALGTLALVGALTKAPFTILNFPVDDIDQAVGELTAEQ
jgi:hypothetical protein